MPLFNTKRWSISSRVKARVPVVACSVPWSSELFLPSFSLTHLHSHWLLCYFKKICQDLCCIRIFATAVHSAQNDFPLNIHSPHSFTSFKFRLSFSFTIETYSYNIIYCCYLPYPVEHLPPIDIQFNLLIHYVYYLFPSLECKFLEGKDLWFIHWCISRTTTLALRELLNSFIKWVFLAITSERQDLQLQ